MSSQNLKTRSKTWYLLPIFLHLIGGAIAFFAIRKDDPQKAKRCLILGGILFGINLIVGFALMESFSNPENIFTNPTNQSQINLEIIEDSLEINLNDSANFLAFRWDPISIPLENINGVNDQLPKQSASDIRNPGTFVPNTIKAGTYHTEGENKEFWFTKNGENGIITIELKNHEFDRIVLESEESQKWIDGINKIILN